MLMLPSRLVGNGVSSKMQKKKRKLAAIAWNVDIGEDT